jgi:uncharacterized protein YbaR (Trm112 family)
MIQPGLLQILRCPETRQKLQPADASLIGQVNDAVSGQRLRNRGGHSVSEKIEGGLVREDGKFLYPVRAGIPVMLIDEAIPLPVA